MANLNLRKCYHRLTLCTSDQYDQKERLLCLKECIEELENNVNFLTKNEVTEIIKSVQLILTNHIIEILNRRTSG